MYFQVYLVDDEELALREMLGKIPWTACGFEVVGTGANAVKAAEEIIRMRPHAVFTDMRMPGLSGTELMERVRATCPKTEFVVVSAYSDFDLVRRSLQLGSFDYLLKPLERPNYMETLQRLYEKLCRIYGGEAPYAGGRNPRLDEILRYMNAHLSEKLTLSGVSERFHLSQNAVCACFNRYLGSTFISCLTDMRMKRAAALLRDTERPVKEIAALCGYDDYFYFCRVFQRAFHCTPTQLRQKGADSDG